MQEKSPEKEKEIEKAIIMLIDCVRKSSKATKPVIMHSLRVGIELFRLGQPKEVVVAGILHDILEDTDCGIEEIKQKFGDQVAELVRISTLDFAIKNEKKRWRTFITQKLKAGKKATLIKLVDANDNLSYVSLLKNNPKRLKQVLWKHKFLIDAFRPKLGNLKVFQKYEEKYQKIIQNLKI